MKKYLLLVICLVALSFGTWFIFQKVSWYRIVSAERAAAKAENEAIESVLNSRRAIATANEAGDPFGEDGVVRVLFIGLDKRAGQANGHCDAIQFITVDRKKNEVTITAVPRGTYSPLPPGVAATSSDYYVSNSCGLVGLEYGVKQIEKILGEKADYLVVVGFSETLGILRDLHLPTTETLQWLRHRQGYAIGEPQRARNHSTFLKQLLTKYLPEKNSKLDTALQFLVYKTVKTDLTFAESETLVKTLSNMDLSKHPERIRLTMRPAYTVQDIPYDEKHLNEYLASMINPIKNLLSPKDYSGAQEAAVQTTLLETIAKNKNDPKFVSWAFDNDLWLQIEDDEKRLGVQYDFLKLYLASITSKVDRESVIADYILEMEYLGQTSWAEKGRALLAVEVNQK